MPNLKYFLFFSPKIQRLFLLLSYTFKIIDMLAGKVIIRSLLWKEDKISCSKDLLLENE